MPVVTGIGHETDVTIADFAADLRAATPTAAAELASPDRSEWLVKIGSLDDRLQRAARQRLNRPRQRLDELEQRLYRLQPRRRLQEHHQRIDELEQRLRQALRNRLDRERLKLGGLAGRLRARTPAVRLGEGRRQLPALAARLRAATNHRLRAASQRLRILSGRLDALSPLATLNRGYAILRRPADHAILRRASEARVGETVEALLSEGRLHCAIKAVFQPDAATGPFLPANRQDRQP